MAKDVKLVESVNALPIGTFWTKYFPRTRQDESRNDVQNVLDTNAMLQPSSAAELKSIHKGLRDQCFSLIEANAAHDYNGSEIKWSPSSKRREMVLPDMRYLLVLRDSRGDTALVDNARGVAIPEVLGFISFMITYEDGHEVAYIYEVHLKAETRGQGLGTVLLKVVEEIARQVGVEKIMLTVFKANSKGIKWYLKNGYLEDEYSPGPRILRNGIVKQPSYMILSKPLSQREAQR